MRKALFIAIFLILFCTIASGFSFANLVGYVTKNNAPTVNLLIPKNNGVTNKLVFSWLYKDQENDPQMQFLLQLDDDWRFESPYNLYGLSEKNYKLEIPLNEGIYYWRVQVKDAYGWSKWSDWRRFDLDLSLKTCKDGTPFWQCSFEVPYYCDGGSLIEDCKRCGCGINEICQSNGLCLANTCSDGTRYGDCSSKYKPKYCQNGNLIDVCSLCGCPGDLECNSYGGCSIKVVIKDQEVPGSRTLLDHIVTFFKKLFGAL